jgi:hypothetical protein
MIPYFSNKRGAKGKIIVPMKTLPLSSIRRRWRVVTSTAPMCGSEGRGGRELPFVIIKRISALGYSK